MMIATRRLIAGLSALAIFGGTLATGSCGREGEAGDVAAASEHAGYSFRGEERPIYEKTVPSTGLQDFIAKGGIVLDVRLAEDFAADPVVIPGAERRDPDRIAEWAGQLGKDRPVVAYCVKGKWVSQKAAAYLSARGIDAYSLAGGLEAWRAAQSRVDHSAEGDVPDQRGH